MSNTKNLANLAAALDDGTSGQVLQSTGSGGVQFADSSGSGVTVHDNQAAMLTDAASASEGSLHYETGTNKLYVKQTSGFYLLASITNASPTIDSFSENTGGAGANNLTADGTFILTAGSNTVITINATEPDLETISYSATVTSGTATDVFSSPSFPVTNQSSNVFTLTPSSATGGTVTIRFDASDGTNVANVSHSFVITFQIDDSHYTTLLMATDGSAGNNQDDISDSSSNNHTITVTGDAHAGTFSPYRHGGYSAYFDGSDYLQLSATATDLLPETSNTTIEAWVNTTGTGHVSVFSNFNPSSPFNGMEVGLYNGYQTIYSQGSWINNTGGTGVSTINDGSWHHLAWVITNSGATVTTYVDGVQNYTSSITASTTGSSNQRIGASSNSTVNRHFTGYISDVRFVKGTAITPISGGPTERLTAVTNTSLLTCHLPYIADGSSNGHSITISGNTSTKPIGPYDYSDEYLESTDGGSIYFDGTGDSLSHAVPALGTGDFEISCWIYPSVLEFLFIFDYRNASNTNNPFMAILADGRIRVYTEGNILIDSAYGTISAGQWYYVTYKRVNGTSNLYVDGSSVGSATDTTSFVSITNGYIGKRYNTGSYQWQGYISDFRILISPSSNGYATPTAPLSSSGTSLHIKGTDAHVIDKSQGNNLKLAGTAASTSALTSGSTPPYIGAAWANTSAVSFDGDSDYVQLPVGSLDLGSSDFTLEAWIYQSANSGTGNESHTIYSDWLNTNADKSVIVRVTDSTGQKIQFLYTTDGSTNIIYTSTATISNATWTHVAVCKDSTSLRFYKDGAREVWVSSPSFTLNPNDGAVGPVIGSNYDAASSSYKQYFDGYIQDLRVTKGLARYTAADESSNIPSSPLKG